MKNKLPAPQTAEIRNPRGSMVLPVLSRRLHPAYALADDVHRSPYMRLAVAPVKIMWSINKNLCILMDGHCERKQCLQTTVI